MRSKVILVRTLTERIETLLLLEPARVAVDPVTTGRWVRKIAEPDAEPGCVRSSSSAVSRELDLRVILSGVISYLCVFLVFLNPLGKDLRKPKIHTRMR